MLIHLRAALFHNYTIHIIMRRVTSHRLCHKTVWYVFTEVMSCFDVCTVENNVVVNLVYCLFSLCTNFDHFISDVTSLALDLSCLFKIFSTSKILLPSHRCVGNHSRLR